MVEAGYVYTSTGSKTAPLGWPVKAHSACVLEVWDEHR